MYRDWDDDAVEAGITMADLESVDFSEPHYTLDQVNAMNNIKKVVEGLEAQLDRIQGLWRDRNQELGDLLQLSEMEQAMRTVSTSISNLLMSTSMSILNDCYPLL